MEKRAATTLVAGLALCACLAGRVAAQQQIGTGRPVAAAVSATDPVVLDDRVHYKLFSFYGTAGQTVRIDLTSDEFDTRLYLEDRIGQSIARDDGSGGRNARISLTLPYNGMYLVYACGRRPDQHGAFTLVITANAARPPMPRPVAAPQPDTQARQVAQAQADTRPRLPPPQQRQPPTPERVPAPPPTPRDSQPASVAQPQPAEVPRAAAGPAPTIPPPAPHPRPSPSAAPPARDTLPRPAAQAAVVTPSEPAQPSAAAPPAVVTSPADVAPTGAIPAPGEIGQIAIGQTARGRLEPGDQTMVDGTWADTWQFQGSAGQKVTIEVGSDTFGPYVQLLAPHGARLADASGSGGRDGARLVCVLPAGGTYQILINNSEGQNVAGVYTISVR